MTISFLYVRENCKLSLFSIYVPLTSFENFFKESNDPILSHVLDGRINLRKGKPEFEKPHHFSHK